HDAPVLGQAALGDVKVGEQLDARGNRRSHGARRRIADVLDDAVDAVTQVQAIIKGFDMDIRGAEVEGAVDDLVDEADDRRFAGKIAQVFDKLRAIAGQ